MSDLKIFFF